MKPEPPKSRVVKEGELPGYKNDRMSKLNEYIDEGFKSLFVNTFICVSFLIVYFVLRISGLLTGADGDVYTFFNKTLSTVTVGDLFLLILFAGMMVRRK